MSDFGINKPVQTTRLPMVPHAVAGLIVAIVGCEVGWAYGIPGIIVGAVGFSLAKKAESAMSLSLNAYRGHRFIDAAFRWSKVAIVQGILLTIAYILYFGFLFSLITASMGRYSY